MKFKEYSLDIEHIMTYKGYILVPDHLGDEEVKEYIESHCEEVEIDYSNGKSEWNDLYETINFVQEVDADAGKEENI